MTCGVQAFADVRMLFANIPPFCWHICWYLIEAQARYQHAAHGYEVPECQGANQATQALRRRWLAPLNQSRRSQILALGLSVAWQTTHPCNRRLSGHWADGGARCAG